MCPFCAYIDMSQAICWKKNIFKVRKLGYQICFVSKLGSKLKNAKFDTHYRICVHFAHILICHKQYVEKITFKVQNWPSKYVLAQNWVQNWKMVNLIHIIRFVPILRIFWYVTSNMLKKFFLWSENWATKYVLAQNWVLHILSTS